ncbi:MAG TPA: hypothetical protein VFL93_06540 [Longimicrobiaceae bacterium]|nr:hypothetical protein [Longimicrobiaceae bacterium]
MIRRLTIAMVLLGFAPGMVGAQQPESAARRIAAAEARVAQAGLPADLLATKVAEGRAKGIPEERIAAVAERRAESLVRAHDVLSADARPVRPAEAAAGADALDAGVDAVTLRDVAREAPKENTAVALAVLGALVRQGLPVAEARARVEAALSRGGEALAHLPQQAVEERAGHGPPAGAGPPDGAGRAGARGRPSGVPGAGSRPGAGKPAGTPGRGPGDHPGGKPSGPPANPGHP